MNQLFSKAIDALESSLSEYPKPEGSGTETTFSADEEDVKIPEAETGVEGRRDVKGETGSYEAEGDVEEDEEVEDEEEEEEKDDNENLSGSSFLEGSSMTIPPSFVEASSRMLVSWEEIDLESQKSKWDEIGITISAHQETSLKNRKSLAEQTKSFKAIPSEEKKDKDFSSLLKAYQMEIDSITKRAKFAENSFLAVYQLLYDAPDVLPVLRSFVEVSERVVSAEQESRRYKQEAELLRDDAATAKSLQAVVRKLDARNKELESQLNEQIAAALAERENEREEEREGERAERRRLLSEMTAIRDRMEAVCKENARLHSDMFEQRSKLEEEGNGRLREMEIMSEEMERSARAISFLEKQKMELGLEVERLKNILKSAPQNLREGSSLGESSAERAHWKEGGEGDEREGEGEAKRTGESFQQSLVARLSAQLQKSEEDIKTLRDSVLEREAENERERGESERLRRELEGKSALEKEAEEMKREIKMLRSLVGSEMEDAEEEGEEKDGEKERSTSSEDIISLLPSPSSSSSLPPSADLDLQRYHLGEVSSDKSKLLSLLKRTNRKLSSLLTSARVELEERRKECERTEEARRGEEEKRREIERLVERLEEDLVKGSTRSSRVSSASLSQRETERHGEREKEGERVSPSLSFDEAERKDLFQRILSGVVGEEKVGRAGESGGESKGERETRGGSLRGGGDRGDLKGPENGSNGVENTGEDSENSLLHIVCAQRERFRARVKELENENATLTDRLANAKRETVQMREDNISLIEKIKFLENYNRTSAVGGTFIPLRKNASAKELSENMSNSAHHSSVKHPPAFLGGGERGRAGELSEVVVYAGGVEAKYGKLYEERMNPFVEFHKREQERGYKSLRLHDKITLSGSKFLLSNKYGRMFVFFYTILLHLFVLFVLYRYSHPRTIIIEGASSSSSSSPASILSRLPSSGAVQTFHNATSVVLGTAYSGETDGEVGEGSALSNTLVENLAENVGTLMEATRQWTAHGK